MTASRGILYDYALRFVGLPYKWGGDDPMAGFDCSGLVIELLQAVGMLPRGFDTTAKGLLEKFGGYDPGEPRFGALLFFGKDAAQPTHVGFALSPELMLEAGGGGSKTLTRADAESQNAYIRVRPIQSRGDYRGQLMPLYPWEKKA